MTPKEYERYKEAYLDLEDELAELPYEVAPYEVVALLQELKERVAAFNKNINLQL